MNEAKAAGYALRRATIFDLGQIAQLERLVFLEPLSRAQVARLFFSPKTVYLVVKDHQQVAAYFGFQLLGPIAHVISNTTHPDYRRLGLASELLSVAVPIAKSRGARWFLGEVRQSNGVQFRVLERNGWTPVGTVPRFFKNGEDAVLVWYPLP